MKNKIEPWSLDNILPQYQNTLIFTQLTDSKVHGYGVHWRASLTYKIIKLEQVFIVL